MKAGNGGEISVKMALNGESNPNKVMNIQAEPNEVYFVTQAFLKFRSFDFRNFQFTLGCQINEWGGKIGE